MKQEKKQAPICAVDYAFQRIGGKHKGRIIWYLGTGMMRYGQLRRTVTGITPKMLTQVLRELEEDELLTRKVYAEVPPRVEYMLTDAGRELLPFIALLKDWGLQQMEQRQMNILMPCEPGGLPEKIAETTTVMHD